MSNFNYWWITSPIMLVGAFIIGWLSTGMKACKPQARRVVDFFCYPYLILCAVGFGVMLMLESYLGFVQVGLSCVAPGESEAWADFLAIGGIIVSAIVFFCLLVGASSLGDYLKQMYLSRTDGVKRRAYCRGVSREEAAMACPYSQDEVCPCGIDRRTRLELTKTSFEGLMEGVKPLFERQTAAGKAAECAITLPIVDGKVSLSENDLRSLRIQAYRLSKELPDVAETGIQRSNTELCRDSVRKFYRCTRANVRSAFGKRTA